MPRPKRSESYIEHTRGEIIEAAASVFARVGFAKATMKEIASEAGCATSTVYSYFEGKDEIIQELLVSFHTEMLDVFDTHVPQGLTLEQSTEMLVYKLLELLDRRRMVTHVVMSSASAMAHMMMVSNSGTTHHEMPSMQDRVTRWFAEEVDPKQLGSREPAVAAQLLMGILHSTLISGFAGGASDEDERLVDKAPLIIDLFLNGVRGGRSDREESGS